MSILFGLFNLHSLTDIEKNYNIPSPNKYHFSYFIIACRLHMMMPTTAHIQYIPRNMHTVFALLCFVVVIHWLIFPYPSGLLHLHCGNLKIAPVPAKQPWWMWINTSCEFIMNDCITTTKQSTTKPCAYFLGYTVPSIVWFYIDILISINTSHDCSINNTAGAVLRWLWGWWYSISQEICTRFCCALLCCGYAIVHNEST